MAQAPVGTFAPIGGFTGPALAAPVAAPVFGTGEQVHTNVRPVGAQASSHGEN